MSLIFALLCLIGTASAHTREYFGEYAHLFTEEERAFISSRPIRKEMRDLSPEEWQWVVDALWVMKLVPADEGVIKYGGHFRNYNQIVCQHLSAMTKEGDDIAHSIPAFITFHRAIEKEIELSLQAIDPRIVGVPYWDFRLDAMDPESSVAFSDEYLGGHNGDPNNNYILSDGKFAFWPIVRNDDFSQCKLETSRSVFGFLRTAYNVQAQPYLVRYGSHYCNETSNYDMAVEYYPICLGDEYASNFSTFLDCYNGNVHGAAHINVGGTGLMYPNEEDSTTCLTWFKWCQDYQTCVACPNCEVGVDEASDCMCYQDESQCDYNLSYVDLSVEQIPGDFYDIYSSTNDPVFLFHHLNIDRYNWIWQIKNYDQDSTYYGFPRFGSIYGTNLGDVAGWMYPFTNIWDDMESGYTHRDILDHTQILINDYVYQDIIDMITPYDPQMDDEQNEDEHEQLLETNSWLSDYSHASQSTLWIIIASLFVFIAVLLLFNWRRMSEFTPINDETTKDTTLYSTF